MKKVINLLFLALFPMFVSSQNIQWNDISSSYTFPSGLKLFKGSIEGNSTFEAWYYEVDLAEPDIAIRPYLHTSSKEIGKFTSDVGAYAAINGGFFSGSSSVSAVVYPFDVKAQNIASLTRNAKTYPVIRSFFGMNKDRSLSAEWIYHFGPTKNDLYKFAAPLAYTGSDSEPLPAPQKSQGSPYDELLCGIGGGPMLLKDGQVKLSYNEEIFWGSGVFLDDYRPRTAVGYTADNKVIMLVVNSLHLMDLPGLMQNLGCVSAVNLDGGQSSSISEGGNNLYYQGRAVPSILAVVHTDALEIPAVPTFEKIIDTEYPQVSRAGSWFETANAGFWGNTRSMLHALGSNDQYYEYSLALHEAGEYEVYAWWVASSNRATNTPFVITHADGESTVKMNQSINGSSWNLVGKYNFEGKANEKVRITAAATTNQYVVADAIRIVSYTASPAVPRIVSIAPVSNVSVVFGTSESVALAQLATTTLITDTENKTHHVALSWTVDGYQPQTPNDYIATATFSLPQGIVQSNPETPLQVKATITLRTDDTAVDLLERAGLKVFPNPGSGYFTLQGDYQGSIEAEVLSLDGAVLHKRLLQGRFVETLDMTGRVAGIYLLRLKTQREIMTLKLVIQ